MNQKIYKLQSPGIGTVMKVGWNCLGDAVRMDGERRVKRLLEGKPGGRREKKKE